MTRLPARVATTALAASLLATACGSTADDQLVDDPPATISDDAGTDGPDGTDEVAASITVMSHDSFNLSEDVLASFTEQTGIEVELLRAGDAGSVLNQAILTKDEPLADVIFGIDNVSLSKALDAGILAPHPTPLPDDVDPTLVLDAELRAIPVDHGDVCLNYDKAAFAELDLAVPATIEDLRDPAYASRLVVEDPATSSPGLAFLLATIAELGEDGWQDFWTDLREGGVTVTSGWEEAYYGQFSGGSGEGDLPLVVSYASSPPAEVLFGPDPEADEAPTGVILDTCFEQVEFAGTLAGTEHPEEAAAFVDFLLSDAVQEDIPLQMFVFPVRDVTLPDVFVKHAEVADAPKTLDPALIAEKRDEWVATWTDLVVR